MEEVFFEKFSSNFIFAVEIDLYKSDFALSCLTYSPGGYISNWIELVLIWKALLDACLFLPEEDDQLRLGRTARLPTILLSRTA